MSSAKSISEFSKDDEKEDKVLQMEMQMDLECAKKAAYLQVSSLAKLADILHQSDAQGLKALEVLLEISSKEVGLGMKNDIRFERSQYCCL